MSRTPQHGGFSEEAIEKAKAEMLDASDFSEQQEAPARNKAGMPSIHGFAEQHFDFKTCQRSNGTFYGTAGDCTQKGSKEVKSEKKAVKKRADAIVKDQGKTASGGRAFVTALGGMLPGVAPALSAVLEADALYQAATDKDGKKRAKAELERAKNEAKAAIKAAKAEAAKAKAEAAKPKAKPVAEKPESKSVEKPAAAKPAAAKPKAKPKTSKTGWFSPKPEGWNQIDAARILNEQAMGKYDSERRKLLKESIPLQDSGRLKSLIKKTEDYQTRGESNNISMNPSKKRLLKDTVSQAYKELTQREIADGKKPTRLSSLISSQFANKLGISVDKENAKAEKAYARATGKTISKPKSLSVSQRRQKLLDASVDAKIAYEAYKRESGKIQWPGQRSKTSVAFDKMRDTKEKEEQQRRALKQQGVKAGTSVWAGVDRSISKKQMTDDFIRVAKKLKAGGVDRKSIAKEAKHILYSAGYPTIEMSAMERERALRKARI